jgi:hypothetical protein
MPSSKSVPRDNLEGEYRIWSELAEMEKRRYSRRRHRDFHPPPTVVHRWSSVLRQSRICSLHVRAL